MSDTDYLAKEADRLKNDPIFTKALADIRADALDALAAANADDKTAILRLQQKVAVINEIRMALDRYIIGAETVVQDDKSPFA
jgi:hypothetical protein